MNDNTKKLSELFEKNPELLEKVTAEANRLLASKEAADADEAISAAAKNILDISLTKEDLKAFSVETRELSMEELDQISGGDLICAAIVVVGFSVIAAEGVVTAVDLSDSSDEPGGASGGW